MNHKLEQLTHTQDKQSYGKKRLQRKVDYKTKKKNMSERKSKNIFLIGYVVLMMTLIVISL